MSLINGIATFYKALLTSTAHLAVPRPALVAGSVAFHDPESSCGTIMDVIKERFMFAAPKRKRSLAVNRERRNSYHIKEKTELNVCPKCGELKLRHHICKDCFKAGRIGGSREY